VQSYPKIRSPPRNSVPQNPLNPPVSGDIDRGQDTRALDITLNRAPTEPMETTSREAESIAPETAPTSISYSDVCNHAHPINLETPESPESPVNTAIDADADIHVYTPVVHAGNGPGGGDDDDDSSDDGGNDGNDGNGNDMAENEGGEDEDPNLEVAAIDNNGDPLPVVPPDGGDY